MSSGSDVVIREVTKDIVTFSKPFLRFGWLPFGGRSTAIRLANGGVWVLASTPLTPETKTKIDSLGEVQYIVAPDALHYLYFSEYAKAYPGAKLVAPEEVVAIKKEEGLAFAGSWGKDAAGTTYGFESDIEHVFFSGFKSKEVAFYHRASGTLIVADLILNLPPKEQYSKSSQKSSVWGVSRLFSPYSFLHKKFVGGQATDKDAMKKDAAAVAAWNFGRIIPCHGDVIETKGKQAWQSVYGQFLN